MLAQSRNVPSSFSNGLQFLAGTNGSFFQNLRIPVAAVAKRIPLLIREIPYCPCNDFPIPCFW